MLYKANIRDEKSDLLIKKGILFGFVDSVADDIVQRSAYGGEGG